MKRTWTALVPGLLAAALSVGRAQQPPMINPLAPSVPAPLERPLAADRMGTTIHRLKNGLTVYLSPNPQEPRVAARIAVRAGSKHDPDDSTGMAHYLEHMLFKGSARLGTLDYGREKPHLDRIRALYEELFAVKDPARRAEIYARIDAEGVAVSSFAVPNEFDKLHKSLGFQGTNAGTSNEYTVYQADFPSNRAEAWVRLEADRFARPVFRLFQSEIETVYEEKNRSLDNPGRILDEALAARLYKKHPYGQRTTLGSIEHLKNPSLAKMYSFYETWYRPNNMAVALSGDFDRGKMLALLDEHLGSWEPAPLPAPRVWEVPPPQGTERLEVRYEAEEMVRIAWLTAPQSHQDTDALMVLDMIMDNSAAGLLNLRLNQAQKVKTSGASPRMLNDAGAWYLTAVPKKGQTLEAAEALLLETVEALKNGEFSDEDIRAIITDFEVGEKLRLESNFERVRVMVDSFVSFVEWERTVSTLDRLRGVTKADVLRVAAKYLGPDRVVAYRRQGKPEIPTIQKPAFTKVAIDTARKSAFFEEMRRIPARPLEPRWLRAGRDYSVDKFPWGRLYATKNPLTDLFALTVTFDRGRLHERELCAALSLLELSGAGALSAEAFKKKLYGLGSKMDAFCREEVSGLSLTGLEAHFEETVRLALERFAAPNVDQATLAKMIEVHLGAHQDNKKNPGYVFRALQEYATRGKESEVLTELTDDELKALSLDKLKALLNGMFDYERKAFYVGVRAPGEAARRLSAGRTKFARAPRKILRKYVKPGRPRVVFAPRDMVQAQVGVYAADRPFREGDAVDYRYYNAVMGGMSGIFFQEVREARSLAYSAAGGYRAGNRKGDESLLWAGAGCQADKTGETAGLLGELLRRPPLSPARFGEARRAVEEDYRSDVIRFRFIPEVIAAWEDLGLRGDPRPGRFARALRYTQADLERFARRFAQRPLTLYVLGHGERAGVDALGRLGALERRTVDELFPY